MRKLLRLITPDRVIWLAPIVWIVGWGIFLTLYPVYGQEAVKLNGMNIVADELVYWYRAEVVKIVDADTVDLTVDLGFNVRLSERFRLYRIDAWETRGEERPKGLKAKEWLTGQIPVGTVILIKTVKTKAGEKKGKYGRWLADLYHGGKCLNDELVRLGFAEYANY